MKYDIAMTLPFWILSVGGVLLLLFEVVFHEKWSRALFSTVFLFVALISLIRLGTLYSADQVVFGGIVAADLFTLFTTGLILVGTLLVVLLMYGRTSFEGIESKGEVYALLLMSTAGAILFCNATELITLFLGLEIMSMALYCLCGASVRRHASAEASLKYFLLGSFSSAFLLYGIALLYGVTGTTFIGEIARHIAQFNSTVIAVALGFFILGFGFKVGVVPFHFWAPDVYQGAPTSITAYMACVVKASAVGAMVRVIWSIFPNAFPSWGGLVWTLAVCTIMVGNLLALRQRNVKRMLAYSSIAHAGYILVAFLVPEEHFGGGAAIVFYLVSYTAMTLGAFSVLIALQESVDVVPQYDLSDFQGLAARRPYLTSMMALFLLTLAGLPPGMAGLMGKFFVFNATVKGGFVGLAVIGVLGSAVSCYYYLRVIVSMFFLEPLHSPVETPYREDVLLKCVISLCGAACIVFGLFPDGLYGVAEIVARSIIR